ncbi:separin protein [Exophiala xenobiotica]|nr:separin protein [Exophiala xenobiotica]
MTATSHPSTVPTTNAIRAELNLPAPTIHTLRFLRSILGLDDQDSVSTTKFEKKKTHTATRPTKHQVPINGKTKPSRKAAPGLQIHEAVSKERPSLSQVERRQIATETFNTTLKQLSDAAKAEKSAAKSYTAGTTPSKPSPAAQPLQERSPNKETRKNGADPKGKLLCAEEADWEVVAGCAQSALQFLRKHQSAEGNAKQDLSLDTEGAALMLLDRTITLGLLKQAELQLADIHRQYWGDASKDLPSETTLAGFILGRPNAACQLSRFRFTTSMQSQGLRLAILAGARCISMDFLNSLQLKTVGSPAWITQQGLNEGRHNSEAAGMQLRTISLALSKLYSTATKTPTEATSSINLFELFCTALEIKFESWRHLCHTVDPGVEVWRPFQGAAKRLFSSAKDVDASMALALQYLCLFQKCLKNTNIESSIPSTIVDMLSQVPHETGASTEFLALLEEQLPTADKVDRLVLTCQIAQWRLKAYSGAVKAAIDSTQRVTDTFNKALDLSQADFERVLLHAAHLRKTAVGVVMTIEKAVVQDGKSDRLQNTVLNLLYTSCWFFCNQIQPKQRLFSRDTGGPASSVFVSTLLKNVDAILTVEKFAAARTSTLAFEALKNCATILESLEAGSSRTAADASLRSTVDHLRVRLSNAFWSRYLTAVKQKNLHEQIHVLQLSLDGLSVLTLAHQKAAYLALKNERLAACYMESNELGRARLALQNALDFNIKEGALSDTVELALAGSLERAWSDPDTNSKALARNLTAYVRLSLQLSCEDDSLFYDDQSLPAIHRAVLLEKQIYAMVDKDLGERQSRSCLLQTNLVLELLHQEECQVYRLRLANNLLHCALKRQLPLSKCPIDTATVEKLLHNHTNPNGSVFLRAYELGLRSILKMQHGFFTSVITCEDLEQSVQQVSQIVRHCKTMDDASNALDNLEALTIELALVHARASQPYKASTTVEHMPAVSKSHDIAVVQALTAINQSEVHLLLGDVSSCRQYFLEAIGLLPPSKTPQKQIEDRPTSRAKVPKGPPRAPAKKPSARPKGRSTVVPEASTPKPSSAPARSQLANEAKEQLSALQIKLNLAEGCSEVILHNEASAKLDGMGSLRSATMQALSLVRQALKMLSEDADTNVLAETAMALPVRYKSARKSGRISFVQSAASQSLVKNTIRMPKGDAGRAQQQSAQDGKELLVAACDILLRLKDSSKAELSSDMVHTAHKIWTQISLLSTVLGRPFVNSSLDLVLDTLSPMDVVRLRERTVMMSEMSTTEKTFVQSWPKLASIHGSQSTTSVQDSIDFDMSLLPASWTIVSLGVSEDRTELLVSRVYADRSPFMLRIPLTRPDMSDGDIEELDFDGAKAEMQQIISKANSSAHDPRGSSPDKAVRKAWYAERQVLDRQLATLLDNIENVWFGGFRGLLSASDVAEKMVYKFSQSFSQTLSRHLPSRQKPSKQAKARVELHSHVLELFVTLGNPREADLEDSITDLLYFVVDILQFNGEKNAYDEIDFDAMLVEVLDALHVYHDEKAERPEKPRHTIMVLDKALQLFPWESMSCLKTCAVSRMPSLGTIWDHLHKMHAMKNEHDGYCIPSSNGAYILNPSSDLLSTQNTFSKVFADQLKGFEAIVDRPPKESEFESILRNKPLLLYFGHGGGAQYIRVLR